MCRSVRMGSLTMKTRGSVSRAMKGARHVSVPTWINVTRARNLTMGWLITTNT